MPLRRLLTAILLASLTGLAAAAPAAADPRTEITEMVIFPDVDPCTGAVHLVTIDVRFLVHVHDNVTTARGVRTLTTSSGYSGRGTSSFVENGKVEMFRFSDRLTDDSGSKFRASALFVLDRSSATVRLDRFELTCLGGSS